MATLGTRNDLKILRLGRDGARLDGGELGELLLAPGEVPPDAQPGQALTVFVFKDGTGRVSATRQLPLAQRGEVAHLKVVTVNATGAFLAWGLPKDLLLPWTEVPFAQRRRLLVGQKVLVMLFTDGEGRMAASARLDDFLTDAAQGYRAGDQVTLLVGDRTDLGVRVIVNHRHWGLIHTSDLHAQLRRGEARVGYVKALREDHRLNITLTAPGYAKVEGLAETLLAALARAGGFLPLTDQSPPAEIAARLGLSKKAFKQTLGALYKRQQILLEANGIRLAPPHGD